MQGDFYFLFGQFTCYLLIGIYVSEIFGLGSLYARESSELRGCKIQVASKLF